jgi:hypothetical protein
MPSSLDAPWHADAAKQARILQIIVAALVMGCLIFLLTTLSIGRAVKPPAQPIPLPLAWIPCGVLAVEAIAWMVVMQTLTAKARRAIVKSTDPAAAKGTIPFLPTQKSGQSPTASQDAENRDARSLLPVYQTKTIISAAMFEGLGFFGTIAYLVEGNPISLGLAVLMILGVAGHFPTPGRIVGWVERQLEAIEVERMTP